MTVIVMTDLPVAGPSDLALAHIVLLAWKEWLNIRNRTYEEYL